MINVENVTKSFRRGDTEIPVLRGISCEIPRGAFAFIVGPSGSGKSTLLYLIGALDEPTSGEIHVAGRRLDEVDQAGRDAFRRTEIGFVFQSFNLLSNLSALDNVLIPYMPIGEAARRRGDAIELLKQVGLEHRLDHRPAQLSGGEQQRVAIARALLKQPSIVLADEPTGELDSENGAEVYRYLRRLQQEQNSTVVSVTHDRSYIQEGDLVLEIRDGRIAE
ncbi:MAG: ABC transporter ATP-binding protein [Planctomycetota bacterium]|nr:MAG: ABC transporter ATP-binding protein [Planctomycetota bacterium]REJ97241.1 MAG: ABC transporter ATP-binding protein [Planctomycetota bacterium]REK30309.1 MAG: ABC transporter ATP-binding protein [Planctomycetota bacterium]REK31540.1 MAG: ABC transporter ATP-binding protein [Planctomycetota bacterium]